MIRKSYYSVIGGLFILLFSCSTVDKKQERLDIMNLYNTGKFQEAEIKIDKLISLDSLNDDYYYSSDQVSNATFYLN